MSDEQDLNKCEQLSLLPLKKMYYSISEVCGATNLEPHILRYWEKEFPMLRPKKNRGGKRAYQDKDIEIICQIKRLLHEEKYTINGARQKLSEDRQSPETPSAKRSRSKADVTQNEQPFEKHSSSESCPAQSCDSQSSQSTQTEEMSNLIRSVKEELKEMLELLK